MIIKICASVNFTPQIIEIKTKLEEAGHQINIPYITQKIIDGEISFEEYVKSKEKDGGDILLRNAQPVDMIKRYWDFIKKSDTILVLNFHKNGIDNYIGGSTLMEMGVAYGHGKKIFLYNPIPERSEKIHYIDEILDMKPIILNGDLNII
jgi:hypothetical protein